MKTQIKGPVVAAVAVVVLGVVAYFGIKSISSAGSLDNGQVKYTPGRPPWLETDPSKKGPGGSPAGGGPGAPQAPGMPVGPATVDNSSK